MRYSHPFYPSPVTITTTNIRHTYGNNLEHAHQDRLLQKCLYICCQHAYQNRLPVFPSTDISKNWRNDRGLASKRFQLQASLEFHLFVLLDPRLVDKHVHLRTGITELAFFIEKMILAKADTKDKYLNVKNSIDDYLKDIICRLTLRLCEKTPSLNHFSKMVANYLMITRGIARPWNSNDIMRAIELRRKRKTGMRRIMTSSAGAA